MTVLKPCPFCGRQPSDYAIEPHKHNLSFGGFTMPDHEGSHVIECVCGCGLIDDTRERVVKKWNNRISSSGMELKLNRSLDKAEDELRLYKEKTEELERELSEAERKNNLEDALKRC